MITAIWAAGIIIGLALIGLGRLIQDALAEVNAAIESIATAVEEVAPTDHSPRPSRTVLAPPGTRLAFVGKGSNGPEICYAPVIAFAESWNIRDWEALAIVDGKVELGDPFSPERVLLPGEELAEEIKNRMKECFALCNMDDGTKERTSEVSGEHDSSC